jgi:hypothetical protein
MSLDEFANLRWSEHAPSVSINQRALKSGFFFLCCILLLLLFGRSCCCGACSMSIAVHRSRSGRDAIALLRLSKRRRRNAPRAVVGLLLQLLLLASKARHPCVRWQRADRRSCCCCHCRCFLRIREASQPRLRLQRELRLLLLSLHLRSGEMRRRQLT